MNEKIELKKPSKQIKDIDSLKRVLEVRAFNRFNSLFKNISNDVSNLLKSTLEIDYNEIAKNYEPDFIYNLRQTYRDTIKRFGFSLRKDLEKKYNLNLHLEYSILALSKENTAEFKQDEQDIINRDFILKATTYINNQSESQAIKITRTNVKEIGKFVDNAIADYNLELSQIRTEKEENNTLLNRITFGILIGLYSREDKKKEINATNREISKLSKREDNLVNNKNKIVADKFKDDFTKRGSTRSKMIGEYEVGATESYIRYTEASILNQNIRNIFKNWDATLDSRTREAHVIADGNYHYSPIPADDFFDVGGEPLLYARDSNGSPENIINCRCVNLYSTKQEF
jgi:uncharacterized protein with gpF-like domain